MKYIKSIVLIILLLTLSLSIHAQKEHESTLRIKIEEPSAEILLKIEYIKNLEKFPSINEEIAKIINDLKTLNIKSDSKTQLTMSINYDENKKRSINIKTKDLETLKYLQKDNGDLIELPKDTINIVFSKTENLRICVLSVDDLEVLNDEDWTEKFSDISENYAKLGKFKRLREEFEIKNPTINIKEQWSPGKTNNQIVVSANTGLRNYKSNWITSANINLEYINGFGKDKRTYGVSWEFLYDFATDSKGKANHINQFVDLYYSRTPFSDKKYAVTLRAGYLTKKSGDLFDKHSFRFAYDIALTKNIEISTEFYFPGNFKKMTPALKLSFSL